MVILSVLVIGWRCWAALVGLLCMHAAANGLFAVVGRGRNACDLDSFVC